MIPKVIHYCWFGKNEIPSKIKKCIESWKKYCPEYKIICWNENNFDVNMNCFVKKAYHEKNGHLYQIMLDYGSYIIMAVFIWIQMLS